MQIHYVPDDLLQQVLKRDKLAKRIRQTNLNVIIYYLFLVYFYYYYFYLFTSFTTNVSIQPAYTQIVLCLQIFKGKAPSDYKPLVLFLNQLN